MPRIKTYNEFVNENKDSNLNEAIDPITLAFALGAIGIAFAADIKNAYTKRKIAKSNLMELKELLARESAKLKKQNRKGDEAGASETQEKIDHIEARIDNLSSEYGNYDKTINSYERDRSTKSDLHDELMALDDDAREAILKAAKKETKQLK